jgi:hypothetical protein
LALSVPLSRLTPRVGGGSAFYVRPIRNTNTNMNTTYKDKLIEVTDREVVFHHYYFPFGGDKHVPFSQIESIQARPASFFGGSWRLWGTGDFRTWFPQDFKRPSRDQIFFASLRGSSRRIGFTVEDSHAARSVLKERGLLHETPSA